MIKRVIRTQNPRVLMGCGRKSDINIRHIAIPMCGVGKLKLAHLLCVSAAV